AVVIDDVVAQHAAGDERGHFDAHAVAIDRIGIDVDGVEVEQNARAAVAHHAIVEDAAGARLNAGGIANRIVVVHLRVAAVVGDLVGDAELVGRIDQNAGAEGVADLVGSIAIDVHARAAQIEAGVLIGVGAAGGAIGGVAADDGVFHVGVDVETVEGVVVGGV